MSAKTNLYFTEATGKISRAQNILSTLEVDWNLSGIPCSRVFFFFSNTLTLASSFNITAFGFNSVVGSLSDTQLVEELTARLPLWLRRCVLVQLLCNERRSLLRRLYESHQFLLRYISNFWYPESADWLLLNYDWWESISPGSSWEYTLTALMRIMSVTIYDDDQIETLPDTQVHREVNLELIKLDQGW